MSSSKYGRTYHYDFSPVTTSDDRINRAWREDVQKFATLLDTEKLDGENTCLSGIGVFARSHAAPTIHPWADHLKILHSMMVSDLKQNNLEIFGENMYAVHSIKYPKLDRHFYVFGVRVLDMWLSWEEVKWYAAFFDLPVVPVLGTQNTSNPEAVKQKVLEYVSQPSVFDSLEEDPKTKLWVPCTREGVVSRNIDEYSVEDFPKNVFKYVRKGHVKTDVHWTRNWKRARLIHEHGE